MVEEGETRAYAQCWAMGGVVSGGVVEAAFRISAAMVGRLRVGAWFLMDVYSVLSM